MTTSKDPRDMIVVVVVVVVVQITNKSKPVGTLIEPKF